MFKNPSCEDFLSKNFKVLARLFFGFVATKTHLAIKTPTAKIQLFAHSSSIVQKKILRPPRFIRIDRRISIYKNIQI
jgi:hypothetical protein